MTPDRPFLFEVDTLLDGVDLIAEPHRVIVGRCGSEPIRQGDVVRADVRGVRQPGELRVTHILRAGRGVDLDLSIHGREVLDAGLVGLLLLTGPPAALGALQSGMNLRGTHAPVTDEEIVASLRPVAA